MLSPQYSFLQEASKPLTKEEEVLLASILSPSSLPLPGEPGSGVWRTPTAPPLPSPIKIESSPTKIEFGEGVSAVFESLGVESSQPSCPHKPQQTKSYTASPSVAPIPILPTSSQAIPIPLPAISHPYTSPYIHINHVTANYHMVAGQDNTGSYTTYPNIQQPIYQQHQDVQQQRYLQQQAYHQQQHQQQQQQHVYQTAFQPGYQQPMLYVPVPVSLYHPQVKPRDERRGSSGSTPVISFCASGGEEEVEDSAPQSNGEIPQLSQQLSNQLKVKVPHTTQTQSPVQTQPQPSPQVKLAQTSPQTKDVQPCQPKVSQPTPQTKVPQPSQTKTSASQPKLSQPQSCNLAQPPPQTKVPAPSLPDIPPPQSVASQEKSTPKPREASLTDSCPGSPVPPPSAAQPSFNEVAASQPEPSKSWASLFSCKSGSDVGSDIGSSKPMAVISPYSPGPRPCSPVGGEEGTEIVSTDHSLGVFLRDYSLKHVSTALLPRGLTNRSNWCFVNAILQALLACPPLYHLMRSLAMDPVMSASVTKIKAPMLVSMIKFMSEFSVLEPAAGTRGQKKDKNKRRSDIVTGVGLEPTCVFNMLLSLEADTFKVVEGRQEDAEEFLTCLLNGLSDEMQEQIKLAEEPEEEKEGEDDHETEEDDWQEVGAKGKSCVTRRVAGTALPATPVQALALGMCRSCVKVEGKDSSATLQPFYTLQLDIQDEAIQSVTDALLANFASEQLDGFVCGKTKQEVEATRSLSLEELPPVLILHLKRFVYDAGTGGVQKIMKPVDFSVDLEISKAVLSTECRSATSAKHRQYKLFSVVCHNGREATKGHYVTDVFHTGYSTWLHCDDGMVQPTAEELVVAPTASSTPYILFYRRGDTMVGSMERREM